MLVEYRSAIGTVTNVLSSQNLDAAVDLASSAMDVRGFEDLKVQRGAAFLEGLKARLTTFA